MAEEENEEGGQEQEEAAPSGGGGSKKRLLLIGIILFLVVAGAGAGGFFMMSGGGESADQPVVDNQSPDGEVKEEEKGEEKKDEGKEAAGEEKKDGEGASEPKDGEQAAEGQEGKGAKKEDEKDKDETIKFGMGKTFVFKQFSLNLGNPLENNYVRLDISVEYRTPTAEEELAVRRAQLRDAIISIVSNKTKEFLQSPDGKEQLRAEILRQINHYMKHKVEQVFITDILIE